ncbi:TMEM165/GDT1 family protein [Pantanalinema rosaneae CENA516]|uniref:TMEM165/GDT1 family protein n=1 Tax=Pantanalinema rosaneae TaxID=1620701 RepID=UPI003D6FD0EA
MLAAFTAGLLLITISELGDKTFFIAMLLAMRHSRRLVFLGVVAALAAMTMLSVLLGQAASLLPKLWIHYAEVILFLGFGIKLLYDAKTMTAQTPCGDEVQEAQAAIAESALTLNPSRLQQGVVLQAFALTFAAEWGDRTQIATIALAASNNPWGVTVGATLGHAICAAIAVIGGRFVSGRLSERTVTLLGGILFLIFGIVALVEGA